MANDKVTFEARTMQDGGIGYYGNYKDFFLKLN